MVVRPIGNLKPELVSAVDNAVARFLHRGVRQADDDDQSVAPTGVDFDFDGIRFNAIERGGTDPR